MKRILILGVLSIASISFSNQQASAWINSNFGAGLNWGVQCGGNDFLFGLCRCGQPTSCVPQAQTVMQPQVFCQPGAAPAPIAPGYQPAAAPVQSFRMPYQSYPYQPTQAYRYGR